MGKRRSCFPYTIGHGVFLDVETLNLIAQVMIPTDSWTTVIRRVVKEWVGLTGAEVMAKPTLERMLIIERERRKKQVAEDIARYEQARTGEGVVENG